MKLASGLVHAANVVLVLFTVGAAALHCDNGAVGVEACRQIENKRCEIIANCPNVAIQDDADISRCQLFYRDQCLFGIADATAEPDEIAIETCLEALNQAADCRPADNISACASPPAVASGVDPATATGCELITFPERLAGCGFLAPAPEETTTSDATGAAGGSAAGGSAAGGSAAGGSGGS